MAKSKPIPAKTPPKGMSDALKSYIRDQVRDRIRGFKEETSDRWINRLDTESIEAFASDALKSAEGPWVVILRDRREDVDNLCNDLVCALKLEVPVPTEPASKSAPVTPTDAENKPEGEPPPAP